MGSTPSPTALKIQLLLVPTFEGYTEGGPIGQRAYEILDCTTGKIITSCFVTFDETNSVAFAEIKRQELPKLGRVMHLDF